MDEIQRTLDRLIPPDEIEDQPLMYLTKELARRIIQRAEYILQALPHSYYGGGEPQMQYGHINLIRSFCRFVIVSIYSASSVSDDLRGIENGPLPGEDELQVRSLVAIVRRVALRTIEEEEAE